MSVEWCRLLRKSERNPARIVCFTMIQLPGIALDRLGTVADSVSRMELFGGPVQG